MKRCTKITPGAKIMLFATSNPPNPVFHTQPAQTDGEVLVPVSVLYRIVYFLIIKPLGLADTKTRVPLEMRHYASAIYPLSASVKWFYGGPFGSCLPDWCYVSLFWRCYAQTNSPLMSAH